MKKVKKMKLDEEFFVNLFILVIVILLYILALNSLLSFLFWPNETLNFLDYIIEIIAYLILATLLLSKRRALANKLIN